MTSNQTMKIKLVVVALLAAVLVYIGMKYQDASTETLDSTVLDSQWKSLMKLPLPKGASAVYSKVDGGVNLYGIDAHSTMLFEIGEDYATLDDQKCSTKLADVYGRFLLDWHPGLTDNSKLGDLYAITGESGMATIRIKVFWFHQILTKQYSSHLTPILRTKYEPKDGLSKRFAEVHVVVCTRGPGPR